MWIAPVKEMGEMDRRAIEEQGIPSAVLMERAAEGIAAAVMKLAGQPEPCGERKTKQPEPCGVQKAGQPGLCGVQKAGQPWQCEKQSDSRGIDQIFGGRKRIAVFCGVGNNGGDGVAAARLLGEQGFSVRVFLVGDRKRMTPDSRKMEVRLEEAGGILEEFSPKDQGQRSWCQNADVIVDALFGIGLSREICGDFRTVMEWMRESQALVVSADIASGIEADTGRILGEAVQADVTVTFTCAKAGHYIGKGALHTGKLILHDIGIPDDVKEDCLEGAGAGLEVLSLADAARLLPERPRDGHKGTFGKVYILGGSIGLTGAPLFASRAAVRSGSGLVFLGVPRQVYGIVAAGCEEAMPYPLSCDQDGQLTMEALWGVLNRMEHCDAGLVGPGLGRSREEERLIEKLLLRLHQPLVLDADGLYAIRNRKELLKERADRGWATILTPHDGEFAYLGGDLSRQERLLEARHFAREYGCVLVLKGHGTLIAAPDGRAVVNATGNCGMAKGGSGDVLAGMLVSLLGQGMEPLEAAALAVWMHGRSGDLCAAEKSVYGMRPMDLVEMLPRVFLELEAEQKSGGGKGFSTL